MSASDDKWPVVKLILQPEIHEALERIQKPGESIQTTLSRILANHFKIDLVIRTRGNPSGKAKPKPD